MNIPTIWYGVTFEIETSPNSPWTPWKGRTARYVHVVKDPNRKWIINVLNTGIWVINQDIIFLISESKDRKFLL